MLLTGACACYWLKRFSVIDRSVCMLLTGVCACYWLKRFNVIDWSVCTLLTGMCTCYWQECACYWLECVHVIDRSVCMLLTEAFQCVPDTPPPGYLSEEGETTDSQDMGKLSFLPLGILFFFFSCVGFLLCVCVGGVTWNDTVTEIWNRTRPRALV